MKNRCAIVVLYDKDGYIGEYVEYLIKSICEVAKRVIVIHNGELQKNSCERLKVYPCEVLMRDNKGYDAEAYREVIVDYLGVNQCREYDEIILCNDSFYGPFVPFQDIFSKMDKKEVDFWGIDQCDFRLYRAVSAYFLVFRQKCMKDNLLFEFFQSHMDKVWDRPSACFYFERGLTYYLEEHGCTSDCYCDVKNVDVFRYYYEVVEQLDFPILKRKCFSDRYWDSGKVQGVLQLIQKRYDYDTKLILEGVEQEFGKQIEAVDDLEVSIKQATNLNRKCTSYSKEELEYIVKRFKKVYLYGVGDYGKRIYYVLHQGKNPIEGYIVSDGHKKEHEFQNVPIYEYTEFKKRIGDELDYCIIVTPLDPRELGIEQLLGKGNHIIYLWD
ncbi:MAG: rhamnan synthesis F family protein [Eubacteriales bacterium]